MGLDCEIVGSGSRFMPHDSGFDSTKLAGNIVPATAPASATRSVAGCDSGGGWRNCAARLTSKGKTEASGEAGAGAGCLASLAASLADGAGLQAGCAVAVGDGRS